ncbi:hypothetical protein [Paraburkholderia aspalathi]|uniref:hypothetical protein n=1 Tax=Paraburkholderia aspalathi TaxID=1324617 RepID=UPI0038B76670
MNVARTRKSEARINHVPPEEWQEIERLFYRNSDEAMVPVDDQHIRPPAPLNLEARQIPGADNDMIADVPPEVAAMESALLMSRNDQYELYLADQGWEAVQTPGLQNNCSIYASVQLARPGLSEPALTQEVQTTRSQFDRAHPSGASNPLLPDTNQGGHGSARITLVNARLRVNLSVDVSQAGVTADEPETVPGTGMCAVAAPGSRPIAGRIRDQGHYVMLRRAVVDPREQATVESSDVLSAHTAGLPARTHACRVCGKGFRERVI